MGARGFNVDTLPVRQEGFCPEAEFLRYISVNPSRCRAPSALARLEGKVMIPELSDEQLWCPVFYVRPDPRPAAIRQRLVLKFAGRSQALECVDYVDLAVVEKLHRDNAELRAEVARLRGLLD